MILPKDFLAQIEYFEHTVEHTKSTTVNDVFILHFKQWWKPKRVIKIARRLTDFTDEGTFQHHVTESAADLYNQLNNYATETFQEKLSHITNKYTKDKHHDNIIRLKPKPPDLHNDD